MKKVVCSGPECSSHRAHHERQDEARGLRYVDVPDDWPNDRPAFCSITCAIMGGYMRLSIANPCPKCLAQGDMVEHGDGWECWQPEPDTKE